MLGVSCCCRRGLKEEVDAWGRLLLQEGLTIQRPRGRGMPVLGQFTTAAHQRKSRRSLLQGRSREPGHALGSPLNEGTEMWGSARAGSPTLHPVAGLEDHDSTGSSDMRCVH